MNQWLAIIKGALALAGVAHAIGNGVAKCCNVATRNVTSPAQQHTYTHTILTDGRGILPNVLTRPMALFSHDASIPSFMLGWVALMSVALVPSMNNTDQCESESY